MDPIVCPKCGGKHISIEGSFKMRRFWEQFPEDTHPPIWWEYEDLEYEPIDHGWPSFQCYDCKHWWEGKEDIDSYLEDG